MKSLLPLIAICVALTGCAARYTYDGQAYPDRDSFNSAVDTKVSQATASVIPLPEKISKKTLVFAVPSEETIVKQSKANFSKANGRTIGVGEEIILRPVWASHYRGAKGIYDAVVRKNIYQSVRYVEVDTLTPNLQPTATEDVLFFTEAQPGAGQYYYVSIKAGKQAFSYDRGGADMSARTRAFTDALQTYAIRD